jgi:hypothetical protein
MRLWRPERPRPESNPALTRNPGRDRPSAISRGQGRVLSANDPHLARTPDCLLLERAGSANARPLQSAHLHRGEWALFFPRRHRDRRVPSANGDQFCAAGIPGDQAVKRVGGTADRAYPLAVPLLHRQKSSFPPELAARLQFAVLSKLEGGGGGGGQISKWLHLRTVLVHTQKIRYQSEKPTCELRHP